MLTVTVAPCWEEAPEAEPSTEPFFDETFFPFWSTTR